MLKISKISFFNVFTQFWTLTNENFEEKNDWTLNSYNLKINDFNNPLTNGFKKNLNVPSP